MVQNATNRPLGEIDGVQAAWAGRPPLPSERWSHPSHGRPPSGLAAARDGEQVAPAFGRRGEDNRSNSNASRAWVHETVRIPGCNSTRPSASLALLRYCLHIAPIWAATVEVLPPRGFDAIPLVGRGWSETLPASCSFCQVTRCPRLVPEPGLVVAGPRVPTAGRGEEHRWLRFGAPGGGCSHRGETVEARSKGTIGFMGHRSYRALEYANHANGLLVH